MNIHMQRRYTISDSNDVQQINAAKHLQLSPGNQRNFNDEVEEEEEDHDLAVPLKPLQSMPGKPCTSPRIPQISPLPAMGLKRKATGIDCEATPNKYVHTCNYKNDDIAANENGVPSVGKFNGTSENRDAIAVPTMAQQELQSAAFRSRLDSMISHYESPPARSASSNGAPSAAQQANGEDGKLARPSTPDANSLDKSCPSSLQPTPVKDSQESAYFGQPRPLNYELSSPKATIG